MHVNCRHCESETTEVIDLKNQPIANDLSLDPHRADLKLFYCPSCGLYQVPEIEPQKIFTENYPYFTGINKSYVNQCKAWAKAMRGLGNYNFVLEIGSNDGSLLEEFKDLNHLGVDPCLSVVTKAREKGVNTITEFWSEELAISLFTDKKADLIIANNVLAHTPRLNSFIKGIRHALAPDGVFVFEVPYVKPMLDQGNFDTIYHEHYSYFSVTTLIKIFTKFELKISRIENLSSHGGSIRVYVTHAENQNSPSIAHYPEEINHEKFKETCQNIKLQFLHMLSNMKLKGAKIAAFGAAAKSTVFCNYVGIDHDLIDFCVDETPSKQNKRIPGTNIPILGIDEINDKKPDFILIFPWNFKNEIQEKLKFVKTWNCRFISR